MYFLLLTSSFSYYGYILIVLEALLFPGHGWLCFSPCGRVVALAANGSREDNKGVGLLANDAKD